MKKKLKKWKINDNFNLYIAEYDEEWIKKNLDEDYHLKKNK